MARRPLPPSQVITSTAREPKLPRRPPMGQRPQPCAEELNKQRQRPVYDEKRP